MPLFTQLCVDGNGESEIVSLLACVSENCVSIGSMLDTFKHFNENWKKTRVILGDKDFADRSVYREKFPDADIQICLWHVKKTFNREITTGKRDITPTQRQLALEILEKLVYSRSESQYNEFYQELLELELDEVTKYYNDNWHDIKDEWTLYGKNQHNNYLNETNNRSESLNQKFKMIGSRHANLIRFFDNVFGTLTVLSSERDFRAVRMTMKSSRSALHPDLLQ